MEKLKESQPSGENAAGTLDTPQGPGDTPIIKAKLQAAEEMARALTIINGWSKCQCQTKHGDNMNCPILIAEAALAAWEKAGKES